MLTNLLAVIRGVQCKGVCVVELGQPAVQCHAGVMFASCHGCGTAIPFDLTYCNKCWEMSPESDSWADLLAPGDAGYEDAWQLAMEQIAERDAMAAYERDRQWALEAIAKGFTPS